MIRDLFARAAEVRDLRDRAVQDAHVIADLEDELADTDAELVRTIAELDQATARVRDLDASVQILTMIAHRLGVTCIRPLPGGDLRGGQMTAHDTPTPYTPPTGVILTTMGEARRIGHGQTRPSHWPPADNIDWKIWSARSWESSDRELVWWRPTPERTVTIELPESVVR